MKLSELPDNAVIHCATLDEAKRIGVLIHHNEGSRFAATWKSGTSWVDNTYPYDMFPMVLEYKGSLFINPFNGTATLREPENKSIIPSTDIE